MFYSFKMEFDFGTNNGTSSPAYGQGNGYRARTTGRGSRATQQGIQTITARVDREKLRINKSTNLKPASYPTSSDKDAYDVVNGEVAVRFKTPRNSFAEDGTVPYIVTTMNGHGTEALSSFPNDKVMQMIAVRNGLQLVGVVEGDSVFVEGDGKSPTIAIQIAGVHSHPATSDMPVGYIAKARPPIPGTDRVQIGFTPDSKIPIEIYPSETSNFETEIRAVLRNYANDPVNFERGMGERYRSTNAWSAFAESLYQEHLIGWAVITDKLISKGVIRGLTFGANYDLYPNIAPESSYIISAILKGLGALPKVSLSSYNIKTGEDEFTRIDLPSDMNRGNDNEKVFYFFLHKNAKNFFMKAMLYSQLSKELRKCVLLTEPQISNLLFGYNPETKNKGIDNQNKILQENAIGGIISRQINAVARTTSALANAIDLDREWVLGKVIKGAATGEMFDVVT